MRMIVLLSWLCFAANLLFSQQPMLVLPIGHTNAINSAKFSADNSKLLTTSDDGSVKIWDAEKYILLVDLKDDNRDLRTADFSPDCKKIITTSRDYDSKIWDAQTGELLVNLKEGLSKSHDAVFSPDGSRILTVSSDGSAKIWNSVTGGLIISLNNPTMKISSAQFDAGGSHVITTSTDSVVRVWGSQNGKMLCELTRQSNIGSPAISPTEDKVIIISENELISVWDLITAKHLYDLKPDNPNHRNIGAKFSTDGRMIVTGLNGTRYENDADVSPQMWDSANGHLLFNLKSPVSNPISHLNAAFFFSPNNKRVLICCSSSFALWDLSSGAFLRSSSVKAGTILSAQFIGDSIKILSLDGQGYSANTIIHLWDEKTGNLLGDLKGRSSYVYEAEFVGDKTILTRGFDNNHGGGSYIEGADYDTEKAWSAETGKFLLNGNIDFPSDDLMRDDDKNVRLWMSYDSTELVNYQQKKPIWVIHHKTIVETAQFSPDKKKIITASWDSTAKIWDAASGNLILDLKKHPSPVTWAEFNKDGSKAVTGCSDGTVDIWNALNGDLLYTLKGHEAYINSVRFSNDYNSSKIVSASSDNTARIWDSGSGKLLYVLKGHNSPITSAFFNASGSCVVTASRDNTCKVWDAQNGKLLYTFFAVDSTDYLITDQYDRYDGTEGARKLLYFTCGTEVIGLDQVKDQLWVPNLAERIMKGDSINAKKLSDLDICGLIPQVEKEDKSGYHFIITPQRGGLGETVVYVNGIEEKRYKPKQLTKTATGYELNLDEKELAAYFISGQENPVTVKAYTANNDISSRGAEIIQDKTKKKGLAPNLYAVMIGVSDYKGPELQLKYAAKDAEDISAAISASAKKLLDTTGGKEHVFMYNLTTGKNHYELPEKIAIKNVFGEIGKKATANDILLIFFAGHGVTSGEKKQFYFLTADASQASATDAPAEVGISTKELSEWMQPSNIKAQKRILILDACNSGRAIDELEHNDLAARNDDKAEQIKAIDKLNEKSGLFILAASASNQSAYEMGRYSQGLLTYSLLKAIKQQPDILEDNKYLNVSRWFNAAEKTVSDMVRETGNRQEPQIVSAGNFNIGVVDQEVMAGIKLADEKPLFTASNLQNNDPDVAADDLHLNSLLDNELNDISARGENNGITYIPGSTSPDAYSLGGRYILNGDVLTVKVNIRQNDVTKYKFELSGTKSEIKALAEKLVNRATDWIVKSK